MNITDPVSFIYYHDPEIVNIVGTAPAIQPRVHLFLKTHKFVGLCINEKFRSEVKTPSEKFELMLSSFSIINPLKSVCSDAALTSRRLFYVECGTIFNNCPSIYEKIIDANKILEPNMNFKFIISVGRCAYARFKRIIDEERYELPENVVLVPFAPQIEILKRASLFITHSGLNSTSEAIFYGVPMIRLPISADQPYVAMRMEELKIGKKLDYKTFDKFQMSNLICEILNDYHFTERVLKYSRLSRRHNGSARAADLLVQIIKSKF